jgi:hypothetical protein
VPPPTSPVEGVCDCASTKHSTHLTPYTLLVRQSPPTYGNKESITIRFKGNAGNLRPLPRIQNLLHSDFTQHNARGMTRVEGCLILSTESTV